MNKEISDYYDNYKFKQINEGINIRHRTIFRNLKKHGLKPHHNVLEIGCGIGTVTKLIAKHATKGKILGLDISRESINYANKIFKNKKNISFISADFTDVELNQQFDFIVLPDVLEHIPIEKHNTLFKNLMKHSHTNTIIFINIPSSHYQIYIQDNKPELNQIIDQTIEANELISNAYDAGFVLIKFYTYSLYFKEGDYQYIVLRPKCKLNKVNKLPLIKNKWNEFISRFY